MEDTPICPICGEECEDIYFDKAGDICGCDRCLTRKDAWEWLEEEQLNAEILAGEAYYDYLKEEGLLAV